MAIRVLTYRALLWEDLIRQKALTSSGKLPPVLSVVLYNGDRPWNGPTSVAELIEPFDDAPEGADPLSYRLIEEQSYPISELDSAASPVAGLFSFEQIRDPGELIRESRKTGRGLVGAENQPLREALGAYVMQRLRKLAPDLDVPWMIDLLEVPSMLEQRVVEWTEQWKQEGRREGRREGEVAVLLRQLRRRYGSLDRQIEERVRNADAKEILEWADRFVTATSLAEVFDGNDRR